MIEIVLSFKEAEILYHSLSNEMSRWDKILQELSDDDDLSCDMANDGPLLTGIADYLEEKLKVMTEDECLKLKLIVKQSNLVLESLENDLKMKEEPSMRALYDKLFISHEEHFTNELF